MWYLACGVSRRARTTTTSKILLRRFRRRSPGAAGSCGTAHVDRRARGARSRGTKCGRRADARNICRRGGDIHPGTGGGKHSRHTKRTRASRAAADPAHRGVTMTGEPMIRGFEDQRQSRETLATLTRHIRVRVLNCSADGCLLETTAPLSGRNGGAASRVVRRKRVRRSDSSRPVRAHEQHRCDLPRRGAVSQHDAALRGDAAVHDAVRRRRIGGLAGYATRPVARNRFVALPHSRRDEWQQHAVQPQRESRSRSHTWDTERLRTFTALHV